MSRTELFTQSSPWYIFICLVIAGLYAFLLYNKKANWSKGFNYFLGGVRFLVVFFLCFLLLSPIVKQIKNYIEKPVILIAIDNSQSISSIHDKSFFNKLFEDLKNQINQIDNNFDVELETFSAEETKSLDSIKFDFPVSNISAFLSGIQSKYESNNLTSVVFLSDGIYNQGISPNYIPYNFTLFPVALGDTIPKKDLNVKNIVYNKVSYRGNKFPIQAEISGEGFQNATVKVNLSQNGKVLETKSVIINENTLNEIIFYASSQEVGVQHYTIIVEPLTGEYSTKNNTGHAYVDIIDNKEKILLIALAPHPDIKAIKAALENKENYEFSIFIPGVTDQPKETKFDLIIFHQIPDIYNNSLTILNQYINKSKNYLHIVANQSNISQFNNLTSSIDILSHGMQKDEVFSVYNKEFNRFTLEEEHKNTISKYPPITVPFADYQIPPGYDIILYQKVGTVTTNKPIIAVGNNEASKNGLIVGDGIWQWRLNEYAINKNTRAFDDLVTKLVQYLSSKEDKRKFKVYPVNNEIFDNEPIVFETEVYNDIYEKIYGQKIDLEIKDINNRTTRYSYVNNKNNSRYEISGLTAGIYKYKATSNINGKTEVATGEFIVKELQLESINTTANHAVLKELARSTGGKLYYPNQLSSLFESVTKNKAQGKVHSSEENLEMIHLKWVFFLILLLMTVEWSLRKYHGIY